ncbi:hypothetical protein Ddc_21002 [Ditylenchus destructor]|nr:hypothetical protein Ddc_21002 [Ditylenchus destructor]
MFQYDLLYEIQFGRTDTRRLHMDGYLFRWLYCISQQNFFKAGLDKDTGFKNAGLDKEGWTVPRRLDWTKTLDARTLDWTKTDGFKKAGVHRGVFGYGEFESGVSKILTQEFRAGS